MAPVRVLVVCTANRVRSPVAAVLLERSLSQRSVPSDVRSVGLLEGGRTVPADTRTAAAELGIDLDGHRSRQVTLDDLTGCDVVVAMEGQHVLALRTRFPEGTVPVVTIGELVAGIALSDGRAVRSGPFAVTDWVPAVVEPDRPQSLFRSDLDVHDPFGRGVRAHRRTYRRLRADLDAVVEAAVAECRSPVDEAVTMAGE